MLESRANIKNPLSKRSGRKAAWYLFAQLNYPFNDFEKFRRILWAAIVRSPWLYSLVAVSKRSGGKRILQIPHPDLMLVQKAINKNILEPIGRYPNVFGFSGGGVKDAALAISVSNQAVFATDVVDAFPRTSGRAVFHFFRTQKYGYYTSYYLTCLTTWFSKHRAEIITEQFGLPQGAPTSPRLFDLCFRPIDDKLIKLAANVKGNYVRYADNIFFSAPSFWPASKKKIVERSIRGCYVGKEIYSRPDGQEDVEVEDGMFVWHSPLISAIYKIAREGYLLNMKPEGDGWWRGKFFYSQHYYLHKSCLIRRGYTLHALGLNIIKGRVHNTREFKRRVRMTIFNLKKALEQKDDFEKKIWPLYLKLDGMCNFIVKESSPNLWRDAELTLLHVFLIRYSGRGGTRARSIKEY